MLNFTFHNMDIFQFAVWFFIYSFLGWAMECIVIRKQKGYWENRGFAKLPFCVIYGMGVFIAFHIFRPIEHNYIALYFCGCICATAFEYLTAIIMLKLFGEVWWNYDHLKFNYKGILCLESTLAWGLLALIIFGFLNIRIETLVLSIDETLVKVISTILVFSYLIDFEYHFAKRLLGHYKSVHSEDEEGTGVLSTITSFITRR